MPPGIRYWNETLIKMGAEGHITEGQARRWGDGIPTDAEIAQKLGFDSTGSSCFTPETRLSPGSRHA